MLAPLIQRFFEELLFGEKVDLYDSRVISRLGDPDVREYVRAVFVPMVREKVIRSQARIQEAEPRSVGSWAPYQATHSERHPAEIAANTAFNLVPCNRSLEVAMTHFLDRATDVAAFAKNQGPQSLRVDCLMPGGSRSLYTPDFIVRRSNGHYFLAETKGRVDLDVAVKARAAIEWCKAATSKASKWEYLYVPQGVFERFGGTTVEELSRAAKPAVVELLKQAETDQMQLPFDVDADTQARELERFIDANRFGVLAPADQHSVQQAVQLLAFMSVN